eukprot:TRINITY_DN7634_c0_g1_i1.p1 TRINITY_DN7634_c0_g1~~TRINITY_DN7634_c0_g1_i1.p1  ORF type:complete len:151 (+),score=31.16 TRINITY_DN7634_c0_g1_i1:182-634(+)
MLVHLRHSKTLNLPLLLISKSSCSSSTPAADDSCIESPSLSDSRNNLSRFSNPSSDKSFLSVDGLRTIFQSLNPLKPRGDIDAMAVLSDPRVLQFVTCHALARKGRLKELRAVLRKIIEEEGLITSGLLLIDAFVVHLLLLRLLLRNVIL